MTRKSFFARMLGAVFTLLLIAACADQTTTPAPGASAQETLLTHIETDANGMVSKEAFMRRAAAMFDSMDSGKKGMMSMESAKGASDKALGNLLTHSTPDQNGMISRQAFMAHAAEMFDKMDTDKKGMMAMSAYETFIKQLSQP